LCGKATRLMLLFKGSALSPNLSIIKIKQVEEKMRGSIPRQRLSTNRQENDDFEINEQFGRTNSPVTRSDESERRVAMEKESAG
jgi:hypothetical protein